MKPAIAIHRSNFSSCIGNPSVKSVTHPTTVFRTGSGGHANARPILGPNIRYRVADGYSCSICSSRVSDASTVPQSARPLCTASLPAVAFFMKVCRAESMSPSSAAICVTMAEALSVAARTRFGGDLIAARRCAQNGTGGGGKRHRVTGGHAWRQIRRRPGTARAGKADQQNAGEDEGKLQRHRFLQLVPYSEERPLTAARCMAPCVV